MAATNSVQVGEEQPTHQLTDNSVERAGIATEEPALQAAKTAQRPEEGRGPTTVRFLILIIAIDDIDDAEQNFAANVYIQLRWKDRRLVSSAEPVQKMPLAQVWNPRLAVVNQVGRMTKSLPDVVQVEPNGTVTYRQRYTGKFSQPLRLSKFPRDKHVFVIQFAAAGYSTSRLKFVPDTYRYDPSIRGGMIANRLSLPDWKILDFNALSMAYQPFKAVQTAGFGARFEAQRLVAYYLWQVVLPLIVVVIMSWAAFWVSRDQVGVRIGVATSSILTMIANRFMLASLLPRLPYMTRMDYLTVGSTLLVILALFMVVAISQLQSPQWKRGAEKLDLFSRGAFPGAFLLLLGWFLFG